MFERESVRGTRPIPDVLILGAGPAGLLLGNLLHAHGIDCLILERASRARLTSRARAGFLAPNTVRILERHHLADGLRANGKEHHLSEFRTEDGRFQLDYSTLGTGEPHTVYPQQHLVHDLLNQYLETGGRILFETEALEVRDADTDRPGVTTRDPDGRQTLWSARYVAGCDGRHGAARRSLPPNAVRRHHRDHGITWLGLLAEAPPSTAAVAYAVHPHGFAGHMARTPDVTRYYLQCERGAATDTWHEDLIWKELELRMRAEDHGPLHRGRIIQRAKVDLESDVLEPLQHGSLFLAGDAASLISPSAAKGANLAVLEAEILAEALIDALGSGLSSGTPEPLQRYSERCLPAIWRAQEFSHWMIRLLHPTPGQAAEAPFLDALRRSRLQSLRTSRSLQDWFAENYVGI